MDMVSKWCATSHSNSSLWSKSNVLLRAEWLFLPPCPTLNLARSRGHCSIEAAYISCGYQVFTIIKARAVWTKTCAIRHCWNFCVKKTTHMFGSVCSNFKWGEHDVKLYRYNITLERIQVIWGQCCLRVTAGPGLTNGPITRLSPHWTQNFCIYENDL